MAQAQVRTSSPAISEAQAEAEKRRDEATKRAAEEAQHTKKAKEAAASTEPSGYKVAPGRSVTTVRGVVPSSHDPKADRKVTPLDFCRGEDQIEKGKRRCNELVKAGTLVRDAD